MAARKSNDAGSGKQGGKDFWSKMLSAQKVRRVLEKADFDTEAFRRAYEADNQRGPRKAAKPSQKEIAAAEAFLASGDYRVFMAALGSNSRTRADSTLRRFIAWKGQNGPKSGRRARSS